MSDTMEDLKIVEFTTADDDDDHWTCCRNDDVSMCGKDVMDVPLVDFTQASCATCDSLINTDYCPLGLICPSEEVTDE